MTFIRAIGFIVVSVLFAAVAGMFMFMPNEDRLTSLNRSACHTRFGPDWTPIMSESDQKYQITVTCGVTEEQNGRVFVVDEKTVTYLP